MKISQSKITRLRGIMLVLACCFTITAAWGYDFTVKNRVDHYHPGSGYYEDVDIFYNINPDGKSVTVTYGDVKYKSDSIAIPAEVTYNGNTYTVTAIGYQAFQQCDVKAVSLPETVTEIQSYAFYLCTVKNINYPAGLKYIRKSAFDQSNVTNGTFPEGLAVIEDMAFSKAKISSLSLPRTLESLGNSCFGGCSKLTSVTIPGNITTIPGGTFSQCSSLKDVIIEDGVQFIEYSAFSASPVETIVLPSTLKKIGDNCFSSTKIRELVLPSSVTEIGDHCFSMAHNLESITLSSGMTEIPTSAFTDCKKLINVNIPNSITKIDNYAFRGTVLLSHITLPESVTEVGSAIFVGSGLVDFKFPSKLTNVSSQMLNSCDNLTEIIIPETVKTIGEYAFSHCDNLRKVTFPDSIESIGRGVFSDCVSLEDINIPVTNAVSADMFRNCKRLRKIVVPEGVKQIGNTAFSNCESLEELQLPKSLEDIRGNFISGCSSLKNLTVYHQVTAISMAAFHGCSLEELHFNRAVLPRWSEFTTSWNPIIKEDNNCTLFVPKGSAETYKASPEWATFKNIVEEEITEPLNYQITFPYSHSITGGALMVNDIKPERVMEFAMNTDVVISMTAKDGYHLAKLLIDGEDMTAEVVDGVYAIKNLDANHTVDVYFAENPVKLSMFMAVGGSVDVEIEKGQTFSCIITPEDGWKVNAVTFNGRDVTSQLSDDNRFTTPSLSSDSELRVTFENVNSSIENITATNAIKVYVDQTGLVTINGVEEGQPISAYSVSGMLIDRVTATGITDTIQLYQHGIYLIQTPVKTYKVHY
ncbi:MAG: leucine-rich repeat domain-containing protein [Bacteroides sp.]|nr:leucine-rich repeat domain-containing protein [Bacteroides sp.]